MRRGLRAYAAATMRGVCDGERAPAFMGAFYARGGESWISRTAAKEARDPVEENGADEEG